MTTGNAAPQRILVRGPNWLGDCVMAAPAMAALRNAFPQAHIAAEARSVVAPVFGWMPGVDETIICPDGGGLKNWGEKSAHAKEVRGMNFDTGILLTNSLSTAFWMWKSGAARRIGTAANGRGILLTDRIPYDGTLRELHQIEWYNKLLEPLSVNAPMAKPALRAPEGISEIGATLARGLFGTSGTKYAMIAPGSAYGPAKDWLHERFIELARKLVKEEGLRVLISGSAKDGEACLRIAKAAGVGVESMAGQTTLDTFLYLLSQSEAFVGNDSGAAHCAAALSIPTVVIFGSTRPERTRPTGDYVTNAVGEAPCVPCMKRVCPRTGTDEMACMKSVTVEQVWAALQDVRVQKETGSTLA